MEIEKEILLENNLYEEFDPMTGEHKEYASNKLEKFLKEYRLNRGRKNILPKNIKRNEFGYIDFDNEPYIKSNYTEAGKSLKYWFILKNGSRVLLKLEDYSWIENEILFKYLCKDLNIPCATVDIAEYDGKPHLLTTSFLRLNEKLVDYYNLMENKYNSDVDVKKLLEKASELKHDSFVRKMLTIDILTGNIDRFPKNFRVIKNGDKYRIAPLFDNSCLYEYGKYSIVLPSINESSDYDDVLAYLMQDKNHRQWCYDKIIHKNFPNFSEQIHDDKSIFIDANSKDKFNEQLENGKVLILDAYKNS